MRPVFSFRSTPSMLSIFSSSFSTKARPLFFSNTILPNEAANRDILKAQTSVFGIVHGNGLRSGRKRLRKSLIGPKYTMWYGYRARDILPEFLSPVKEEFFRDEEALQRLGKTRIKGKMLPQLKSVRDKLRFDESFPEASDKVESLPFDALLTESEKKEMSIRSAKCITEFERSSVENEYVRIALDREQRPQQWDDYLDGLDATERNKTGEASTQNESVNNEKDLGKQKKKGSFIFRSSLDDKRQWGQKQHTQQIKENQADDIVSKTESEESINSNQPSSQVSSMPTSSSSTTTPLLETTSTDTDPISLLTNVDITNKEMVDKAFHNFVLEKAKRTWEYYNKHKSEFGKSVMIRDLERKLEENGYQIGEEGLVLLFKSNPAEKSRAFAKVKFLQLLNKTAPSVHPTQLHDNIVRKNDDEKCEG